MLFLSLVKDNHRITYDYESFENGILSAGELIQLFARATHGDWLLQELQEDERLHQGHAVLDIRFSFNQHPIHWEIDLEDGLTLPHIEQAIQTFARQYLPGRFLTPGSPDQLSNWFYLPAAMLPDLHELVLHTRHSWPSAEELISFFEHLDAPDWEEQWTTILYHSDFTYINQSDANGHYPLHTLVEHLHRHTRHDDASYRREMLSILVDAYDANPALLDTHGYTAFHYAYDDLDLLKRLQPSPVQQKEAMLAETGATIPENIDERTEDLLKGRARVGW
jgi:hypothetical protein